MGERDIKCGVETGLKPVFLACRVQSVPLHPRSPAAHSQNGCLQVD